MVGLGISAINSIAVGLSMVKTVLTKQLEGLVSGGTWMSGDCVKCASHMRIEDTNRRQTDTFVWFCVCMYKCPGRFWTISLSSIWYRTWYINLETSWSMMTYDVNHGLIFFCAAQLRDIAKWWIATEMHAPMKKHGAHVCNVACLVHTSWRVTSSFQKIPKAERCIL